MLILIQQKKTKKNFYFKATIAYNIKNSKNTK